MSGKKCKVGVSGKTLSSRSKEIISNVYTFMKKESEIDKIEIPPKWAHERTAVATGVSVRTVSRINAERFFQHQRKSDIEKNSDGYRQV